MHAGASSEAGGKRAQVSPNAAWNAGAPVVRRDPNPGLLCWLLHGAYDLAWVLAAIVATPWLLLRMARGRAYRSFVAERLALSELPPACGKRRVLVHGVSVGEIKGAAPLVRRILEQFPDAEVVLSSTTDTGMAVARQVLPGQVVVRFPVDVSFAARRFLRKLDPICVVLMELEIWPNFLRECNRRGVPVAVVNGRITSKSFWRYRWLRQTLPQFNRISLFCAQNGVYAERFQALSNRPERVLVTGSMKADGLVIGKREVPASLQELLGPAAGQKLIVAGSTHEPEELLVARAWMRGAPDARLVIVPRHPQRADEVRHALTSAGAPPQLLSRLRAGERPDRRRPAIVDTIGELENVYALADLVFVGGSLLPHGGQNMLEPAAQGKAVIYGPHIDNFVHEATLLEEAGASRRVADAQELERAFREFVTDDAARTQMGQKGLSAVDRQKGATALTLTALARLIAPA